MAFIPGNSGTASTFPDGFQIADGTVTAPTLKFSDSQTGWYRPGLNQMALASAGVQTLLVSATGAVTLGASSTTAAHNAQGSVSADFQFKVVNSNATNGSGLRVQSGTNTSATTVQSWFGSGTNVGAVTGDGAWTLGPTTGTTTVQHTYSGYVDNNWAHLLFNRSTNLSQSNVIIKTAVTSGTVTALAYWDGNNQLAGYVNINTTADTVSYVNSSDARLKANHRSFNGIALVAQMNPTKYERLSNPGVDEIGLVAQELHSVLPEAVAVGDEDVSVKPWGIDYGRITPVLVKAIQELKSELDAANARITQLEGGQ